MKRFYHHGELIGGRPRLWQEPRCCMSNQSVGPSTSATITGTTSGQSSPVAAEDSMAVGSGSIGVGSSGKYLESGATDNSGAYQGTNTSNSISTGSGSSVIIGDPNADSMISSLAQQFSQAVQNVSSDAASGVQAAVAATQQSAGTISYKTLGIILAVVAAVIGLFTLLGRKK